MEKRDIFLEFAYKFDINIDDIKDNSRFAEDLNLDSIDLVEGLMEIEFKYDIQVPDDKIADLKTAGEFAEVIINIIEERGE